MSVKGRLHRGAKWYSLRDRDGIPKSVTEDKNKMADVNFYLDWVKSQEPKKEEIKSKVKK